MIPAQDFVIGDVVVKASGEARYVGVVVSIYQTTRGAWRLVIDVAPQGFQMIAAPGQITRVAQRGGRSLVDSFAAACGLASRCGER